MKGNETEDGIGKYFSKRDRSKSEDGKMEGLDDASVDANRSAILFFIFIFWRW
jgi:hypothetical protein